MCFCVSFAFDAFSLACSFRVFSCVRGTPLGQCVRVRVPGPLPWGGREKRFLADEFCLPHHGARRKRGPPSAHARQPCAKMALAFTARAARCARCRKMLCVEAQLKVAQACMLFHPPCAFLITRFAFDDAVGSRVCLWRFEAPDRYGVFFEAPDRYGVFFEAPDRYYFRNSRPVRSFFFRNSRPVRFILSKLPTGTEFCVRNSRPVRVRLREDTRKHAWQSGHARHDHTSRSAHAQLAQCRLLHRTLAADLCAAKLLAGSLSRKRDCTVAQARLHGAMTNPHY